MPAPGRVLPSEVETAARSLVQNSDMRVVVIGGGEVGENIGETLSAERHDVTLVERDAGRVEALQGKLDALVVQGNGASPRLLQEIGVGLADLLLAVTETDEVNVIAALAAHQLGAKKTVARVRDPDYFGPDGSFAHDVLGIDFLIHPERATAEDLAAAIVLPGAVHVEHFSDGQVAVAECILTERSPLVTAPLGEVAATRPHRVFAVIRRGRAELVRRGEQLRVGDHVLMAARRDDMAATVAQLAGRTPKVRDVVIFGGVGLDSRSPSCSSRSGGSQ